jgi:hypothetical protein
MPVDNYYVEEYYLRFLMVSPLFHDKPRYNFLDFEGIGYPCIQKLQIPRKF